MKKLFLALVILIVLSYSTKAQTKPAGKADTAKTKPTQKSTIRIDTLKNVKFPVNIAANKFDRIDSADLNLTPAIPIEKYGYVDTADLKMTSCDFEKDANAMVLFDRAEIALSVPEIVMERQRRVKIFNDNGKSEANIRIDFDNKYGEENIMSLEAETITLSNGKIEYTKLDPKLIYGENTDNDKSAVIFSMPNVKAGSIIEYRYMYGKDIRGTFPPWPFQCNLPTRYSQLNAFINPMLTFSVYYRRNKPFVRDTISMAGFGHVWALSDIPSIKDEPYMRSQADNLQSLSFIVSAVSYNGQTTDIRKTWPDAGKELFSDKYFYKPFDQSLRDEDDIVKQAKTRNTDDSKIAFLFKQVKTSMKWNDDKTWLSADGIKSAWKKKSGNWGEINMILCRLLKLAGIKAYPMMVSTRDNGKLLPEFVNVHQVNKLVVYIPVDTAKYYVLDASDKYNVYNEVPFELLNSYGLFLDKEKSQCALVFIKKQAPVKQVVFIQAEINPSGAMNGTAEINNFSYNKSNILELHEKLDEKKFKEFLTNNDNNIKITSLKLENAETDSLPLLQTIDFSLDLPGTDDKYIYFSPNLFTSLHDNPFVSKNRESEIDFGYTSSYSINGRYKIPAGYKIESLPKSMNLLAADRSISFKRMIGEDDGNILVNYVISYKKSVYPLSVYADLYAYFKKMNEILNEQIVLKKSG